jgi:4a-hydroxytetrahydrobiopterin dehydratase
MAGHEKLSLQEAQGRLSEVPGWEIEEGPRLVKRFKFSDFVSALAFVNRVGEAAESQQHHPDIHLTWGKVRIELWTHSENGLTDKDFALARRIDELSR